MKHLMWAFLLLSFAPNAAAQNKGYTLDTAPWSNQKFEVCPIAKDNGLRPVIFEPEIEEWTYTTEGIARVELVPGKNGITETFVTNKKQLPAYFLKEQKIAYLDNKNNWVDENGIQITRYDQLKIVHGKKTKPETKGLSHEKYVYLSNIEKENAAALEKIHYAAPCTVFQLIYFDKMEAEFLYDFGDNNPYQCDAKNGLKRSQAFNYTRKISRPVVSRPDGSTYYIKFPNGDIKTYGWTGIEQLYNKDGALICEWNDLGTLIGYELIQSHE